MAQLFYGRPDAVFNTLHVAEQCAFDLATGLGYTLPQPAVPEGIRRRATCDASATRPPCAATARCRRRWRSGWTRSSGCSAGTGWRAFLLLYREIALLAQQLMEERGLAHPETPLEERPPGRGRGSSVAC